MPAAAEHLIDWRAPSGAASEEFDAMFWGTPWGSAPRGELPPVGITPRLRQPRARYDLLGRKQPQRLIQLGIFAAIPGVADRIRRVPARAVEEEGVDESGADFALIVCPCGHRPIANDRFEKCGGCERAYAAFGGGRVLVFYLDMEPPQRIGAGS